MNPIVIDNVQVSFTIVGDFSIKEPFLFSLQHATNSYALRVGMLVHMCVIKESVAAPYMVLYERYSNEIPNMKVTKIIGNSLVHFSPIQTEGGCPVCGEVGDYINLAPVCSTHGVY
jgi:hypothetical protein